MNFPVTSKNVVLYADDDTDDLELVAEAFSKYRDNVELVTVTDGLQALSYLTTTTKSMNRLPCLIILDINMPRLTGRETLIRLREIDKFEQVPVILFSTSSQPYDKEFAQSYGAGFITKPLDYRQMDRIAEQFLQHCSDEIKSQITRIV